jgi:nucleotide-binding universal stress UspA family protein
MTDIVVGVDGSEASKEALQWALDEAEHRGLPAPDHTPLDPVGLVGAGRASSYLVHQPPLLTSVR